MNKEMIIVLDFGGQYNQLIARRVRECNVYAEVHPYTLSLDKIKEMNPKGIIFTGGPNSVYGEESPRYQKEIFDLGIPILGICYGSQLMAYMLGGTVETAPVSEYGRTEVDVDNSSASCLRHSSIQRLCILKKDRRCCQTSFITYVDAPATGRWIHLLRQQSVRSVRRLETERYYVPCPEVSIPP